MPDRTQNWYEALRKKMKGYSDLKLISSFNGLISDTGAGWADMFYFGALKQEFADRNIDLSTIENDGKISRQYRIALYNLDGKKVVRQIQ